MRDQRKEMGWLSKLRSLLAKIKLPRWPSKVELDGIVLDDEVCWAIDGRSVRDFGVFFRSLGILFPQGGTLYFEGGPAPEVKEFFLSSPAPETAKVARGTIWPKPCTHHIPLTQANLDQLADLEDRHALPEICDHFHVYREAEMLLMGHDFGSDPIYVSTKVDETRVKEFCLAVGCEYSRHEFPST